MIVAIVSFIATFRGIQVSLFGEAVESIKRGFPDGLFYILDKMGEATVETIINWLPLASWAPIIGGVIGFLVLVFGSEDEASPEVKKSVAILSSVHSLDQEITCEACQSINQYPENVSTEHLACWHCKESFLTTRGGQSGD